MLNRKHTAAMSLSLVLASGMLLLLSACGGGNTSTPTPVSELQEVNREAAPVTIESPANVTLQSPAEMLRQSTAVNISASQTGASFDESMPSQNVEVNGGTAIFTSTYQGQPGKGNPKFSEAAFAVYRFPPVPAHDGRNYGISQPGQPLYGNITFEGATLNPVFTPGGGNGQMPLIAGVANVNGPGENRNRWDWMSPEAITESTYRLTLGPEHQSTQGIVIVLMSFHHEAVHVVQQRVGRCDGVDDDCDGVVESGHWSGDLLDHGITKPVDKSTPLLFRNSADMDVDGKGRIHVAYHNPIHRDLVFATRSDNGSVEFEDHWSTNHVASAGDVGSSVSLYLDEDSDGDTIGPEASIAFTNRNHSDLRFAQADLGEAVENFSLNFEQIEWTYSKVGDFSRGTRMADSFFDITYDAVGDPHIFLHDEVKGGVQQATQGADAWKLASVDASPDNGTHVDSFFDVFTELSVMYTGPKGVSIAQRNARGTWDTEILSMDLHAPSPPSGLAIVTSVQGPYQLISYRCPDGVCSRTLDLSGDVPVLGEPVFMDLMSPEINEWQFTVDATGRVHYAWFDQATCIMHYATHDGHGANVSGVYSEKIMQFAPPEQHVKNAIIHDMHLDPDSDGDGLLDIVVLFSTAVEDAANPDVVHWTLEVRVNRIDMA